ncbi:MAG: hypothetical protein Q4E34_05515 [Synergistaceae bacterium]|nr:hypothetical protein [Synergistaceae bacterium]
MTDITNNLERCDKTAEKPSVEADVTTETELDKEARECAKQIMQSCIDNNILKDYFEKHSNSALEALTAQIKREWIAETCEQLSENTESAD